MTSYLEAAEDEEELAAEDTPEELMLASAGTELDMGADGDESGTVELCGMLDSGEDPGTVTLSEEDSALDRGMLEL